MNQLRKSVGLATLAAMVMSAQVATSAVAGPSGVFAPGTVATQTSSLIANLEADGESALPIVEVQHRHRSGGRRGARGAAVAGGIALGVAAAIALSQGANAAPRREGYGYSCRRWYRLCEDGEGWACRRLRREC